MAGIDWAYVSRMGGEGIEDFAAACLRQRYDDAQQSMPARGDGGVDIFRETAEGLIVWQVKKFVLPLTPAQKQQVKRSWKRFWNSHVVKGETIKKYYLATPWTPTDAHREWFAEITADAIFPTQWDGAAFFDGLAAEFPATADRFCKGSDMLESMVNAKAMLAASPVEISDEISMMEALSKRDQALREIADLVSDNDFVNTGTRSTSSKDDLPLPGAGEAGLFHRYTYVGNNRFYVQSVVPKNAQSTEVEPVTLDISFKVEPGSDDARKVDEWRKWGVPFEGVQAQICQRGGPLQDSEPHTREISFLYAPEQRSYPDLEATATSPGGQVKGSIILVVREITRGIEGGGVRIVAVSLSGVLQLELRHGSTVEPDSTEVLLLRTEGLAPAAVRDELLFLTSIDAVDMVRLSIHGGPTLQTATGMQGSQSIAAIILPLAADLVDLQAHSRNTFRMPDLEDVSDQQINKLHQLAEIYRGRALETTWEQHVLTVKDPDQFDPSLFSGKGALRVDIQPTFNLGDTNYTITQRLAHHYLTPRLASVIDSDKLATGDEVELVPGDDNRWVIAAVVDDPP